MKLKRFFTISLIGLSTLMFASGCNASDPNMIKVKCLSTSSSILPIKMLHPYKINDSEDSKLEDIEQFIPESYGLLAGQNEFEVNVLLSNPKEANIRAVEFACNNPNVKVLVNDGYGNTEFINLNDSTIQNVLNWTSMSRLKMTYHFQLDSQQEETNISIVDILTDEGWQHKHLNNKLVMMRMPGEGNVKITNVVDSFKSLEFDLNVKQGNELKYFFDDTELIENQHIKIEDNDFHYFNLVAIKNGEQVAKAACTDTVFRRKSFVAQKYLVDELGLSKIYDLISINNAKGNDLETKMGFFLIENNDVTIVSKNIEGSRTKGDISYIENSWDFDSFDQILTAEFDNKSLNTSNELYKFTVNDQQKDILFSKGIQFTTVGKIYHDDVYQITNTSFSIKPGELISQSSSTRNIYTIEIIDEDMEVNEEKYTY